MNISNPRVRKFVSLAGYVAFALIFFGFALQWTFPYDRVKAKFVEALSEKYVVSVGAVERGFIPGKMIWRNVAIVPRPKDEKDSPAPLLLDTVELDIGLLGLLRATAVVDIDITVSKTGAGKLEGTIEASRRQVTIELEARDLPAAQLPIKNVLLPMTGKLDATVNLKLPLKNNKADWFTADGKVTFGCDGPCTIGDGETKLKMEAQNQSNQIMVGDGIAFGKVFIEKFAMAGQIRKGVIEVTKFDLASKDGEAHIDYKLTLNKSMQQSEHAGCVRFKGSEELAKREPNTHSALQTTGAMLGPDGLFHLKLSGNLARMRKLAKSCGPGIDDAATDGKPALQVDTGTDSGRKYDASPAMPTPVMPTPVMPTPEAPLPPPPPASIAPEGSRGALPEPSSLPNPGANSILDRASDHAPKAFDGPPGGAPSEPEAKPLTPSEPPPADAPAVIQ